MKATGEHVTSIVDSDWLVAHLEDPTLRVVEVDVSRARYDQGHIPGALVWNVYTDLHHTNKQVWVTKRHPGGTPLVMPVWNQRGTSSQWASTVSTTSP